MVSKETEVRWRGGGQRHVGPCKLGCVKVAQSCPTLFDPMDYTVHGILQARILDWVAIPFPEDLPSSGIRPRSPALQVGSVPAEPPGKSVSWGRECNFYFKSSGKLQMRCSHLHNVKHFIHLKDLSGFCAAPRRPGDAEGSVEKWQSEVCLLTLDLLSPTVAVLWGLWATCWERKMRKCGCWNLLVLLSVAKAPHSGGPRGPSLSLIHPACQRRERHSDTMAEPRTGRQWLKRVRAWASGRAVLTPVLTPAAWLGQMSSAPSASVSSSVKAWQ